ncbi:hypothetical protein RND71_044010 [Anisodus tanguticus]|uniref:polyribonucleotide nucleotidyltransferase n=1 Tax=Anisodus tanguticus TaxID=243964 RepID=A0AAE1QNU7_9SOLA|nr:hypothetical protein RND71_044010 [Anisodus tanguticus]
MSKVQWDHILNSYDDNENKEIIYAEQDSNNYTIEENINQDDSSAFATMQSVLSASYEGFGVAMGSLIAVAAVSKDKISTTGFMPLTVDYREKASAGGRIPTNHLRRDLMPNEKEILTSRIIDRSVRNSFPNGYLCETQLFCNVLSIDAINDPDIAATNAASTALSLSNIPWDGPVGTIRISYLNGQYITNPTKKETVNSDFNIVCTSNKEGKITMLEGFGNKPVEFEIILHMIDLAIKENLLIIEKITELTNLFSINKRTVSKYLTPTNQQKEDAFLISNSKLREIFSNHTLNKTNRDKLINEIRIEAIEKLKEHYPEEESFIFNEAFIQCFKRSYAEYVFESGLRCDGRNEYQFRPLYSEVNLFKPLHGSALFQRGLTQVLGTLTFDSPDSALKLNNSGFPDEVKEKNFMLHYEFPPFATNDTGRLGFVGRREIGHGSLAEKGLKPIVPDDLPFVIRLTCEVLESNGSSSMASVCAGSLSLMDAGLQIDEHVAGVAIGLIKNEQKEFKILTDILGLEDYFGEMDLKIAGTKKGFTAMQLDSKLKEGINFAILRESFERASSSLEELIDHMGNTISKPNLNKNNLPVTNKIEIPQYKKGAFLGFNGFNLKKLKAQIGVTITQDNENVNAYNIFAPNQDAMDEAKEFIDDILIKEKELDLEFGAIYTAKILEIKENGVIIKIEGQPPLFLHNKHLDKKKIKHASSLGLEIGSSIQVKYFGRDPANGEMADSDDDHGDRHSRDKFKRERNDYQYNKRSNDWNTDSGNSNWQGNDRYQNRNNSGRDSFGRDQKPNGNFNQRRYNNNDMSPPQKRFRNTRDWEDRGPGFGSERIYNRNNLNNSYDNSIENSKFRLKYHPEESIKRKKQLRNYLISRRECFIDLLKKGKINSISLDVDKTDEIIKLLDTFIIKLEGGDDEDIKALDELPKEEKSKEPELDLFRVDVDDKLSNESNTKADNMDCSNDENNFSNQQDNEKVDNNLNSTNNEDKENEEEEEEPKKKRAMLHKTSSIFLRNLPANITKEEIDSMFIKYPEFLRSAISEPLIDKKFLRKAWVSFERNFDVRKIYLNLSGVKIRNVEIGAIINKDLTRRVRLVSGIASHKNCVLADIRHAAKIVAMLDHQKKVWEKEEDEEEPSLISKPLKLFGVESKNPLLRNITEFLIEEASAEEEELLGAELSQIDGGDQALERNENSIIVLDRLIYYLRFVHSFDYYNACEYPNEDEMPNKIGLIHVRGLPPSLKVSQKDVDDYIKAFENKIAQFIQPTVEITNEELSKLGLRNEEAEVEKFIQENIQEIGNGKWLCPLSGKKFKGPDFVRKHLLNKHEERLEEIKQEAKYFNNYVRDVKRPQLPEHPANKPVLPTNRTDNINSGSENQPVLGFQMRANSRVVAQPNQAAIRKVFDRPNLEFEKKNDHKVYLLLLIAHMERV